MRTNAVNRQENNLFIMLLTRNALLLISLFLVFIFRIDGNGCCSVSGLEQYGDYKIQTKRIRLPGILDSSNRNAIITFPSDVLDDAIPTNNKTFPLLIFAHGFMAGGWKTYPIHKGLLDGLASFGFIVVAPQSCNWGCPGFGRWDKYDDEIITLARYVQDNADAQNHEILKFANRTMGFGILGHSMGGGAAAQALQVAAEINVKAGVILHPIGYNVNISVPTAVYTGTSDVCCGEVASKQIYNGISSSTDKAFANMIDAVHTEPNFATDWTAYTAAWFKIYLVGESEGYFFNLIYGTTDNSLCSPSSDLPMDPLTCEAYLR